MTHREVSDEYSQRLVLFYFDFLFCFVKKTVGVCVSSIFQTVNVYAFQKYRCTQLTWSGADLHLPEQHQTQHESAAKGSSNRITDPAIWLGRETSKVDSWDACILKNTSR